MLYTSTKNITPTYPRGPGGTEEIAKEITGLKGERPGDGENDSQNLQYASKPNTINME